MPLRLRKELLVAAACCAWCGWPDVRVPEDHPDYRRALRFLEAVARAMHQRGRGLRLTYCHELQVDHIVPLDRGGPNTRDNMRVLCNRCNIIKGTMTDAEVGGAPAVLERRRVAVAAVLKRAARWRTFENAPFLRSAIVQW